MQNLIELDAQKKRDVNLFPDRSGSQNILSLFDRTVTKGGAKRLAELFSTPSTDVTTLKQRVASIMFWQSYKPKPRFDHQQMEAITFYLNSGISLKRKGTLQSVVFSMKDKWRADNDYFIIKRGINAIHEFLQEIRHLYRFASERNPPIQVKNILDSIDRFCQHPLLSKFIAEYRSDKLIFLISQYDLLLRSTMASELYQLLEIFYEIEAFFSIAETASSRGFAYPVYHDDENSVIEFTNVFHPLIDNAVGSDFSISGSKNLCFLTGANMSGKSTFLKAVGIAVYLAHCGFPVPADSLKLPVCNGLITTINLSDNLHAGLSHFYSEVKRVKEVALQLKKGQKLFVIFDELFRGTNIKDAYKASLLIIEAFAKIRNSYFIISTHILELADELQKLDLLFYRYFLTTNDRNRFHYTRQLKEGVAKESLGLDLVIKENILDILEEISTNE
ncbi:MAG: hypothetical protein WBA74_17980 [Cyclobacteriaceae bacterium]